MIQIKGFPDYYIEGDNVYRRYKNGIAKKLKPFASDPTTPANRVTLYNKGVRKRLSIETIKNMVVMDIPKEEPTKKKIKNKYIHSQMNVVPNCLKQNQDYKFVFYRNRDIKELNDLFGTKYTNIGKTKRFFKVIDNVISSISNTQAYIAYPLIEIKFDQLLSKIGADSGFINEKMKKCLEVVRDRNNHIIGYKRINYESIKVIDGITVQNPYTDKHKIVEVIYE